jgi:TorA maturation chaperone TorD
MTCEPEKIQGDAMMTTNSVCDATFDPALSLARQSLYRFAALSLVDPKVGTWEQLDHVGSVRLLDEATALIRNEPAAQIDRLAPNERPLSELDPARVLACLPKSSSALNDEYEATFGLLVAKACPPYETEYIDGKFTFQRSHALADISGFYRAFGLQPSDELPERHDHIVLELEFMALLFELERRAAESGQPDAHEKMMTCRNAQRRFLTEHLAWWAPAFAKVLGKENKGGFYEAVGVFLAALIPVERSFLGVEPQNRTVTPSPIEQPEECDGCMLAAT